MLLSSHSIPSAPGDAEGDFLKSAELVAIFNTINHSSQVQQIIILWSSTNVEEGWIYGGVDHSQTKSPESPEPLILEALSVPRYARMARDSSTRLGD